MFDRQDQPGEMVDHQIAAQFGERRIVVAEAGDHARHARRPGAAGVGGGVADHHRPGRIAARQLHGLADMGPVRLARTDPVRPGDDNEMPGQAKGVDQRLSEVGPFVGGHAQQGAARRQVIQRFHHPVEGPAVVGDMGDIVVDEMVEQLRLGGLVPDGAGLGETVAQQGAGAMTDEMARRGQGHGRMATRGQHPVEGPDQVRGGVHQGAVQIKGDGPALEVARDHRHLPPVAGMG